VIGIIAAMVFEKRNYYKTTSTWYDFFHALRTLLSSLSYLRVLPKRCQFLMEIN